jgi:predicted nucleotidyltransferase
MRLLSALIYQPVILKGSLLPEGLWNSEDALLMPEIAGFVDGAYNTVKALPDLPDALEQATDLARTLAFNYTLNRDGYRDAANALAVEMATDLDTYLALANAIEGGKRKITNIYRGTTREDRYYRGIIAFEAAVLLLPLTKTKAAIKTARSLRGLLEELKALKLGTRVVKGEGSAWKWLPDGAIKSVDDLVLGTGNTIKYNATRFIGLSFENQVKLLTENVIGLTKEQAEFLINQIKTKNGRIVFGGSRVRGNSTALSDLDIGFDGITQNQLYDIVNKYNKQFFGGSQSTAPGALKDKFILTGNTGKTFPEIKPPEEFFMRSGNRHYFDKDGIPYVPSGFISVDALGNVHLGKL